MKSLQLLIVDDHDLIIEGYKAVLQSEHTLFKFKIVVAKDCEEAHKMITSSAYHFDIAIFDWILPEFNTIHHGGDLSILAKKYFPQLRSIIITSQNEAFNLYDIIRSVKPVKMLSRKL